jgi:hypothetical protein
MSRVILICGYFDIYEGNRNTGKKEFVVSYGIEEDTFKTVILPVEHPSKLGGRFDTEIGEWVLDSQ